MAIGVVTGQAGEETSRRGRARTDDLFRVREALSQLSYAPSFPQQRAEELRGVYPHPTNAGHLGLRRRRPPERMSRRSA